MYVPFASSTEYGKSSVLRHHLNKLGLTTIAIEPVAAYKISPRHAAAAGLIAQYSTAELRKYADTPTGTPPAASARTAAFQTATPKSKARTGASATKSAGCGT